MRNRNPEISILYYPGLDSKLSKDKIAVLERYGEVTAPQVDYKNMSEDDIWYNVNELPCEFSADLIIGSSMGGLMALTAAHLIDLPCLVFNPALAENSLGWNMEEVIIDGIWLIDRCELIYIVLGALDTVVDYKKNRKAITELQSRITLSVEETMGHRVPLDVFEWHVASFFQTIHPRFMLI